jgi:hypothetical protein
MHFYKTNWFLESKQKTNFYLTVVEEPSNAVRCENVRPLLKLFPVTHIYMPLKTSAFPISYHH